MSRQQSVNDMHGMLVKRVPGYGRKSSCKHEDIEYLRQLQGKSEEVDAECRGLLERREGSAPAAARRWKRTG